MSLTFADLAAVYARRSSDHVEKHLSDEGSELPTGSCLPVQIEKLYRARQSTRPQTVSSVGSGIAVCAVVVDSLPHEDIWKAWQEDTETTFEVDKKRYTSNFYIHAKHPNRIDSKWISSKLIAYNYYPEWNSPEVVRAMLATLEAALADTNNEKFIFTTESCVPLYSLQEMGDLLFADEKSWLNASHTPASTWEQAHCFATIDNRIIPKEAIFKAIPGWIMLTRRHASEIVALLHKCGGWNNYKDGNNPNDLVSSFGPPGQWREENGGVFAPEEMFFATMLGILGYLRKDGNDEVLRKSASYARWQRVGDANPIYLQDLSKLSLDRYRQQGAVMARKFRSSVELVEQWKEIILNKTKAQDNVEVSAQKIDDKIEDEKEQEEKITFVIDVGDNLLKRKEQQVNHADGIKETTSEYVKGDDPAKPKRQRIEEN